VPVQTVIGASDGPEEPGVQIDPARLLLGDWTWEPATSRPAGEIEEGPLGGVDLSLRVLHDLPAPGRDAVRHSPGDPAGRRGHLPPPLWKRLAYLLQPPTDLLLAAAGPIEWPAALFPYQVDAVRTLLAREAILLADDTGLGKTVEAIAALRVLVVQHRMQAALLVVPAGLLRRWRTADAGHAVLILSLRAGGVGLNLQDASYVFHFDRWWNPSVERQAEDRSHRLGQAYPVNVYAYTCEQTVEERIEAVLLRKRRLFQDIVDDVTLDLGDVLTSAELFSLFGLSIPTTSRA
jgi:hypothetical protein